MTIPTLRATYAVPNVLNGAPARHLAGFAAAWCVTLVAAGAAVTARPQLWDAQVYWSAWHGPLYAGGFVYPPPAALLFVPAGLVSWPVFAVGWLAVLAAAGAWLLWPLPLRLRIPLFVALAASLSWGNAATLLAVPLALAPRYPGLWTLLAWTKVTPAVAAVSLVRQRRWGALAGLGMLSALILAAVVALAPGALGAWLGQLRASQGVPSAGMLPDPGLPARLVAGAVIAWWGASRPWTLALAAFVATPDANLATLGILAGVPRLLGDDGHRPAELVSRAIEASGRADAGA